MQVNPKKTDLPITDPDRLEAQREFQERRSSRIKPFTENIEKQACRLFKQSTCLICSSILLSTTSLLTSEKHPYIIFALNMISWIGTVKVCSDYRRFNQLHAKKIELQEGHRPPSYQDLDPSLNKV